MLDENGKCIATAYYYSSERSYAFWFSTEDELKEFLDADDQKYARHTEWEISYVNDPALYGTGNEISTW